MDKLLSLFMPGVQVEGIPMQQVLQAKTGRRIVPNLCERPTRWRYRPCAKAYKDGTLEEFTLYDPSYFVGVGDCWKTSALLDTTDIFLPAKLRKFFQNENARHQGVIWSKMDCYSCRAVKEMSDSQPGVDVVVHEIDKLRNGKRLQGKLASVTEKGPSRTSLPMENMLVETATSKRASRGVLRKIL